MPPFPDGVSPSRFPSNSVFLFCGGKGLVALAPTRYTCLVSYKSDCILQFENGTNAVFISGDFFDEDGKLVAELNSNRFEVALPPTVFRVHRPNKSTLIVRDSRGVEVLNLKYLNPSAFEMTGTIRLPDKRNLIIRDDEIQFPGDVHIRGYVAAQITRSGGSAFGFQ